MTSRLHLVAVGKSILMDGISFVQVGKTKKLRVRKLGDLIHAAPVGKPVPGRSSVTINCKKADGRQRRFTRSATNSSSEFRIDGQVISLQQCNPEMENFQILVRASTRRCFLQIIPSIYALFLGAYFLCSDELKLHGQIESIAMKSLKERTALIEEIARICKNCKISDQRPLCIQVKQEALHMETKLENGNNVLNDAQKLAEKAEQQAEMLEKAACPTRIQPKIEEIEERMVKQEREIGKLEDKSHAIADDVFASFFFKIGVKNIQEYEEHEIRFLFDGHRIYDDCTANTLHMGDDIIEVTSPYRVVFLDIETDFTISSLDAR
ncbi:unnamed protein product [Angiostrongylus costaricensis]|uniref:Rad60-SLD domain-containing protein n=1 Tax=Angiostrongylus costaricensis TaxID=334426 RepID=A0A158PLG5_ANGCS|nr:unnamed protein product [Angiostrongylus costaricensis]